MPITVRAALKSKRLINAFVFTFTSSNLHLDESILVFSNKRKKNPLKWRSETRSSRPRRHALVAAVKKKKRKKKKKTCKCGWVEGTSVVPVRLVFNGLV